MASLKQKYETWSEAGKNIFILACIAVFGALVCLPFCFFDNIGVLFGWLLGSAVNVFAYVSIAKGASWLLGGKSAKMGYLSALFALLRLALYAGGLVLAAFCSFRWGSLSHGYCNLVSLALAYMPMWIVLLIATLIRNKKAQPEAKKEETKEEPWVQEDEPK